MNGGQFLGGAILAFFTFFGVVPIVLNTVSQFTVLKTFADEMVRIGVIEKETVEALMPKKQLAGIIISALILFVVLGVCFKAGGYAWACAGIAFLAGLLKYRQIIEFNSLTVIRFKGSFKGEYDEKKLNKYIETHF